MVVIEHGEDEPHKIFIHGLIAGLGGEVKAAGVDCDMRVGVVPSRHTQRPMK